MVETISNLQENETDSAIKDRNNLIRRKQYEFEKRLREIKSKGKSKENKKREEKSKKEYWYWIILFLVLGFLGFLLYILDVV